MQLMIKWKKMGSMQPDFSHPSVIPPSYYILVLNIKGFFFKLSWHHSIKTSLPLQYVNLIYISQPRDINGLFYPQGMKNSFTICQLHVSQVLENIPNDVLLIHYMNDLFLAHPDAVYLQRTAENVLKRSCIFTSDGGAR